MPQKPGLKRDLAAERAARRAATQQARLVPQGLPTAHPDQLMPSPENGRKRLLKIDELAETLRSDGMNTAMTVIPPDVYMEKYPQHRESVEARVAEGVLFVVHHGHRRLAAAVKAGLTEVPILVRRDVPSLRIAAIQENLQRMALNPIEEALEFREVLDEKDDSGKRMSQRELAKRVGCSQTYVSHRVSLVRLVPALQQAVIDHWLKEQQLYEAPDGGAEDVPGRLLVPVREAATVFARLRPDLQEAFVRGDLTSDQALLVSKMPTEDQDFPLEEEAGDCAAIAEDVSEGAIAPLPEPRPSELSAVVASAKAAGSPSNPPSDRPPVSADRSSRDPRSLQSEALAASATPRSEPRGVIVVRDVEDLALNIMELLERHEIDELKARLSY
ncbi:ParB/RepB/Spo0J family partition protein [Streptomyces chartreusis]|uniref:ParB N-terminal domain-containing protein n=1 Tax=Streptomyces chartreusis TaxID=1969 RepID=A0A7H8T750_STRCX|nr:ParB N-terminal domain-containing protein [Streptomyces chartreusis]QKZ18818.1 ParB N-terminal domain-containing protein [Streptomyces chartreusis]